MIKIDNLHYKFKTTQFEISNLNLEISDGEFVCIIGKNGSGKSTFSKLLAGLTKFKTGNIFIDNILGMLVGGGIFLLITLLRRTILWKRGNGIW